MLVMIQPDLGTALVFVAIMVGALFLAGASLRWMAAGWSRPHRGPARHLVLLQDYQRDRLLSFLDPSSDPQGAGFQVMQAQIAVGSGGIFGKGLTNGRIGVRTSCPFSRPTSPSPSCSRSSASSAASSCSCSSSG